ncbi:MAG: hypothetical protein JXB36_12025, partial [Gammaproteobacteria bacterium]|nr:hypothetical protein [Gammaproteobacteria bacterium]
MTRRFASAAQGPRRRDGAGASLAWCFVALAAAAVTMQTGFGLGPAYAAAVVGAFALGAIAVLAAATRCLG